MRQLEILFFGLACFEALPGRFRVLFPEGRRQGPYRITRHDAALWVRNRSEAVNAQWEWPSPKKNDFPILEPRTLEISGLERTPLDTYEFERRVMSIRDSDPRFELAANPETALEMVVDRGKLSSHQMLAAGGLFVVRWLVNVHADATAVRFTCGASWLEVRPEARQVIIANAGVDDTGGASHFLLYRKVAQEKVGTLEPKLPPKVVQGGVEVIDPSHGYTLPPPSSRTLSRTPLVECSPVSKP